MQLAAEGQRIKALEIKPELYPDLFMDYEAFVVLSSSRRIGMDVTPIPISEIKAYADYFAITDYLQRELFLRRIQILDRAFLDWHRQKAKTDTIKDS